MAQRIGQKLKLSSIDELLGVPSTEGTVDLDVLTIYPFENHPFKVIDDEKMEELVESIKESGVLTPVLVRPDDEGTYEMISGHRRLHAAKRAGLRKIPAIIKEMTNDDATIAMVNANMQREEILPSEKAFAYKMKLDAIRSQGKRRDLTSDQVEQKLDGKTSREIIAEEMGCSGAQVARFIRLTELIPKLLDMVDEKRLALSVAVELSYFNNNYQQWLYEYIHENGMLKQEQLIDLRQYRDDDSLTQEQMIEILIQKKATPQPRKKITITERRLNKYFPAYYSQIEIERVIVGLLEQWKASQEGEEK
ncbi:chromosome partitioning protein, ParB family [Butyrivibrio hungatei]|uniref:Chromosome partitioning protein, ParB family n=1 Tax=Butyrivibrio hungatei TaxID=185008 RepID=A0A1G5EBG9_9FIRM|nr:ParB/RepB/Spo0J family partition protein [Butyrivibrio hungatei]SCY24306.1 chromosome partitioning protein, ParB family [Butyrivibrio hungatei]